MQNNEYFSSKAISQSALKQWQFKSPAEWKRLFIDKETDIDKKEEGFLFGSVIDTLIFTPDLFKERFYIATDEKSDASDAIKSIVKSIYDYIVLTNSRITEDNKFLMDELTPLELSLEALSNELILKYLDEYTTWEKGVKSTGWCSSWKSATRINKLKESGSAYFHSLCNAQGRKVISEQLVEDAVQCRDVLLSNECTKEYFIAEANCELLFQLELFIDYKKVKLKGALDNLLLNHSKKTVMIIDFKSSFSAFEFRQFIHKFGYGDQLSFYTFLIKEWLKQEGNEAIRNYTILPPINIVIDIREKVPYVYRYNFLQLDICRYGSTSTLMSGNSTSFSTNKKIGWQQTLDEIAWHIENNYWLTPREMKNCGVIEVKNEWI